MQLYFPKLVILYDEALPLITGLDRRENNTHRTVYCPQPIFSAVTKASSSGVYSSSTRAILATCSR